jgi:Extracellular link domain
MNSTQPFNFTKVGRTNNVAPNLSGQPSFLTNIFGSFTTVALLGLLFVLIFIGIFVYFKTIGYTVQTGWSKLMNIFGKKDTVDVGLTEDDKVIDSIKLVPPAPTPNPAATNSAPGNANSPLPFSPDERPSGMPGAQESKSLFAKAIGSVERAFDPEKQVFNVSRNLYTYEEAAPLCKAMGAELATYEQVQVAQKHGADWCNYGWVKGQMAVYPTQEATWNKLQQGPAEYRGACGKPGVNGGIFDNPDLRFGVNCFGPRPQKKDTDELLTDTDMGMPPTAEQIEFDKKVQQFRDQLGNITVLPWSRSNWSG